MDLPEPGPVKGARDVLALERALLGRASRLVGAMIAAHVAAFGFVSDMLVVVGGDGRRVVPVVRYFNTRYILVQH